MKKSDIFNKSCPNPLDRWVYDIYAKYRDRQQEIVEAWKADVVNGGLRDRGYNDLSNLRTDVTKDGRLIVRTVPMIGLQAQEDLTFYIRFFNLYKTISSDIIGSMIVNVSYKKSFNDREVNDKTTQLLYNKLRIELYPKITALKMLVAMVRNEVITRIEDLEVFESFFEQAGDGSSIRNLNQLLRDKKYGEFISPSFQAGVGDFYDTVDPMLVQSYWNNVRILLKRAKGACS